MLLSVVYLSNASANSGCGTRSIFKLIFAGLSFTSPTIVK